MVETQEFTHAAFVRGIDANDARRQFHVSVAVVGALAVAIVAAAFSIGPVAVGANPGYSRVPVLAQATPPSVKRADNGAKASSAGIVD